MCEVVSVSNCARPTEFVALRNLHDAGFDLARSQKQLDEQGNEDLAFRTFRSTAFNRLTTLHRGTGACRRFACNSQQPKKARTSVAQGTDRF